ncbi:hypothetical protein FKP32DRAFT_1754521 [Trametes sanguinea]|nr:hypothetical protein FKP32DRAFT_1754521 [Trametes sanguinea]
MERPRLNYDVLLLVLGFSDKPTLACLMQTCRELYRPATTHILQGVVTLTLVPSRILSLSSFLLTDSLQRMPHLRKLEISDAPWSRPDRDLIIDSDSASSLNHLLQRLAVAGYLEELILYELDDVLYGYPHISDTIESFTSLQSIQIFEAGEPSESLLANLESCLVSATISFEQFRTIPDHVFRNPVPLLSHSRNTLRRLYLLRARLEYLSDDLDNEVTYPNVTDLILVHTDVLDISRYISAFPRLQRLETTECNDYWPRQMDLSTREDNEEAQKQSGTWPKLDVYDGSLLSLWQIAIACPISSLKLTHDDLGEVPPTMAIDVLTAGRPVNLELRVRGCRVFLTDEVLRIFRHSMESLSDLQSLRLDLDLAHGDSEEDWNNVLDSMVSNILAPLPSLSSFELNIKAPMGTRRTSPDDTVQSHEVSERSPSPLLQHVADWDQTAFIERACGSSRNGTLEEVKIVKP